MTDKKNEDGGAILTPEDFDSTRNTELAACLITLGFPLLNNTPGFSRVIGEGIAGPAGLSPGGLGNVAGMGNTPWEKCLLAGRTGTG